MNDREPTRFQLFEVSDVLRVPFTPGIYAWFLKWPISKTEQISWVAERFERTRDATIPDPIDLISKGAAFGVSWGGSLQVDVGEGQRDQLEEFFGSLSEQDLSRTIEHFNNVMAQIPPLLYVGKANSLRTRIKQHLAAIERLSNGSIDNDDDDYETRTFAERIHVRNIALDYLRFSYFEFPNGNPQDPIACKANELVEGAVNQTLRPILGKR